MKKYQLISCTLISIISFVCTVSNADEDQSHRIGNWLLSGELLGAGSFNQYDNWQSGGTDTTAITIMFDTSATYKQPNYSWKNSLAIEYGLSKIKSETRRKSTDVISLDSIYTYHLKPRLGLYGRFAFKSSLTPGYVYYDVPVVAIFTDNRIPEYGTEIRFSDGLEPIALDEGVGVSFTALGKSDESKYLAFSSGVAGRQLVADSYYIEEDDDETKVIEFSKIDAYSDIGVEIGINFKWILGKNAKISSDFDGFYGLGKKFIKTEWDTSLSVGISKHFGISLSATMVYDELVIDDLQWKTGTLLTLSYRFF